MTDYKPENSNSGLWLVILAIGLASTLVVGLLIVASRF